jgi:hypothetical protein
MEKQCYIPKETFLSEAHYKRFLRLRERVVIEISRDPGFFVDELFRYDPAYVNCPPEIVVQNELLAFFYKLTLQEKESLFSLLTSSSSSGLLNRDEHDGEERKSSVSTSGRCFFCSRILADCSVKRRFVEACDRAECQEDARQVKISVLRKHLRRQDVLNPVAYLLQPPEES